MTPPFRPSRKIGAAIFAVVFAVAGATVSGPGLTWDEPAYRGSQVLLQQWLTELATTRDPSLLSKDEIDHYWEFNRFGPNFHPPMGSYLNLATFAVFGGWLDDIAARRLAAAAEFAGAATLLYFLIADWFGMLAGVSAAALLATMPRLLGDAHVIGTDMPLLFFWLLTSLCFVRGLSSRAWQWAAGLAAGGLFLVKFSGVIL
ncbi:MAG TPA: glycosyltransferase family 39 protein, partial [Planctomycetia bacterium]|nr:glycosyltransferase family 39 protein [Planctomycetia bacterium]